MMRRMVKLNLIEIKIRDLQFFLHFLFFCCAGRLHSNLIEIKIRDLQFFLHFLFFCRAGRLHRNLIEIKKKNLRAGGLDVRRSGCCLCIVNLYTALTEVMFDGNNLIEINPGVFPGPSACILLFILLTLFNYIVEKYLVYFLHIFEKSVTFVP